MNGNEPGPPSTYIYVYITSRPRLALIERKLMKPILRRNKFVQPPVSIGYTGTRFPAKYILTRKNVLAYAKSRIA